MSSSIPKNPKYDEYSDTIYNMLYGGRTEEELAGSPIYTNEVDQEMIALFTTNVPGYLEFPELLIQKHQIDNCYIHLKEGDLRGENAIRGKDCFNRHYIALHVKSKATQVTRIVAIFQSNLEKTNLTAASYGEGALGHNELFGTSSPSWEEVRKTIDELINDRHGLFFLELNSECSSLSASSKISTPTRYPSTSKVPKTIELVSTPSPHRRMEKSPASKQI
jgi:hypothetical protein